MKKQLLTFGTVFFLILSLLVVQVPQNTQADDVPSPYSVAIGVSYAQVLDYYKLATRTKLEASVYAVKHEVDCYNSTKDKSVGQAGVTFSSADTSVAPLIACVDSDYKTYDINPAKDWAAVCKKFAETVGTGEWKKSFTGVLTKETCDLVASVTKATSDVLAQSKGTSETKAEPASPVILLQDELDKEYGKLANYIAVNGDDIQQECQKKQSVVAKVINDDMIEYAPQTYRSLVGAIDRCRSEVNYDLKTLQLVSENVALIFYEFFHTYPQHVTLKKLEKEFQNYEISFADALSAMDTIDAHVPGQVDTQKTK